MTTLLTACGGGSSGSSGTAPTSTTLSSAFNGNWLLQPPYSCQSTTSVTPGNYTVMHSYSTAAQSIMITINFYPTTDCSGAASGAITYLGTVTQTGTSVVSGKTVSQVQYAADKVTVSGSVTVTNQTELNGFDIKQIIYTDGTYLYMGTSTNNISYPTTLGTNLGTDFILKTTDAPESTSGA